MNRILIFTIGFLFGLLLCPFSGLKAESSGGNLASFNLSYANHVVAGEPFAILVSNAVDDQGQPADGWVEISLLEGGDSPDGYQPILNNVYVENGNGISNQYLFLTGPAVIRAESAPFYNDIYFDVLPAALHRLEPQIASTQFEGHKLIGPATIIAYDLFGNIKTDLDASDETVTLSVDRGSLKPTILDGADDFVDGVADLTLKNIIYEGDGGQVRLSVVASAITPGWIDLYFNKISFRLNKSLPDTIYVGGVSLLQISALNEADRSPLSGLEFESYFVSCPYDCQNIREIPIIKPGNLFSFWESLRTDSLEPTENDTLVLHLTAKYYYAGDTIWTTHSIIHPVTVIRPINVDYLPGSFSQDTSRTPTLIDEATIQFILPEPSGFIDPTLVAALSVDIGDGSWERLYAPRMTSDYDDSLGLFAIIFYELGIPDFSTYADFEEGYRSLKVEGVILDGGNRTAIMPLYDFDSLYLAFPGQLSYVVLSLSPTTVYDGSFQSFNFDIELDGIFQVTIDPLLSRLELFSGDSLALIGHLSGDMELEPQSNSVTTAEVYIPEALLGRELTARLILAGYELSNFRTDTLYFGADKIMVSSAAAITPRVRILSCEMNTINPPFVNHNQSFSIAVEIENLSEIVIDSITVKIQSEDGSITYSEKDNIILNGSQNLSVELPMTAPDYSISSMIYKAVVSAIGETEVLPPVDNITSATVQSPARLELVYDLEGVNDGFIDLNTGFIVYAKMTNHGEAAVHTGAISLETGGYDFGISDPSVIITEVDSFVNWSLTSPDKKTGTELILKISDFPIDKNSGLPALTIIDSLAIPITVDSPGDEAFVGTAVSGQTPLIIPGERSELFQLLLANEVDDDVSVIALNSIDVCFTDRYGRLISPSDLLIIAESGFYTVDDSLLTEGKIIDQRLHLVFSNFLILPGGGHTICFVAKFRDNINIGEFASSMKGDDIHAMFTSGPRAGQSVSLGGESLDDFELGENFVISASNLEKSLMVNNNPFNPHSGSGEVEIAYYLTGETEVAVDIYTLTGEKVYRRVYPAGSMGGRAGNNKISWDGRNDEGRTVLNGVYILSIEPGDGQPGQRLKLAVMK